MCCKHNLGQVAFGLVKKKWMITKKIEEKIDTNLEKSVLEFFYKKCKKFKKNGEKRLGKTNITNVLKEGRRTTTDSPKPPF